MYFDLTDEEKMLKESVDYYVADTITDAAIAAYADAHISVEKGPDFKTAWQGIVDMGLPASSRHLSPSPDESESGLAPGRLAGRPGRETSSRSLSLAESFHSARHRYEPSW